MAAKLILDGGKVVVRANRPARHTTHASHPPSPAPARSVAAVLDEEIFVEGAFGFFYHVNLGRSVRPQHHRVDWNGICTCDLGADCPATHAVRNYLAHGGQQALMPRHGYYPIRPAACPICGAKTYTDQTLGSPSRGEGWGCRAAGKSHYWADRARILQEGFSANPWLFPPVVVREGKQVHAWGGILNGDQVLYAGVLREEVGTVPEAV